MTWATAASQIEFEHEGGCADKHTRKHETTVVVDDNNICYKIIYTVNLLAGFGELGTNESLIEVL